MALVYSITMMLGYYRMNEQRTKAKEKILFWTLMVLVLSVLVYSPLHYGFSYP
ncbi:unnamed protein product, partial [marine sediment metagenome]